MSYEWTDVQTGNRLLVREVGGIGPGVRHGSDDEIAFQFGPTTCALCRELLRVVEERDLLKLRINDADRLADEVAALVTRRVLDSRSAAADALLVYRETPRTERSDRIAALEAENAKLREALSAFLPLPEGTKVISVRRGE